MNFQTGDEQMEDKKTICELLTKTLQATRNGEDVTEIIYDRDEAGEEYATVRFTNGYSKRVCVTADSGTSLIKDVLRVMNL